MLYETSARIYNKRMLIEDDCVKFRGRIEGLHDAVSTYTHTIMPCRLVSFCMARYILATLL